jgi:serine/threonine protein kinase
VSELLLTILARACKALGSVHAANVVHGDVKLANFIYREGQGDVWIVDFGFARRVGEKERCIGMTPFTASPEVSGKREMLYAYVPFFTICMHQRARPSFLP